MGKSPKKPITKRPWFWPVVGVVAVGTIAGGGSKEEDTRNLPQEPDKSIVQVDTSKGKIGTGGESKTYGKTSGAMSSAEKINSLDPKEKDGVKPDTSKSEEAQKDGENKSSGGGGNNLNTYDNEEQQKTEDKWVLNTSTKKIHYPSCSDVKKIAPKNYSTSNLSESELKNQGYTTCGRCH